MPEPPKKKCCTVCGKPVRAYHTWEDWESRTSHYKCWKESQERLRLDAFMKDMLEGNTSL